MLKAERGLFDRGIVIEDGLNRLEIFMESYFTLTWLVNSNSQSSTYFYINREDNLYPIFAQYYDYLKEAYIHLPYSDNENEIKRVSIKNRRELEFAIKMNVINSDYVHFISDSDNQDDIFLRDDVRIFKDEKGIGIVFSGSLDKPYYKVRFKGEHSMYKDLNIPLFRLYSVLLSYIDEKNKKLEKRKV